MLEEAIELNLRLGRRTNPAIRCAGISLNTSRLTEVDARRFMREESARLQLPVADPMRNGPELERLVDSGKAAVAFAMYPVTVADLFAVSDAGEIMPPKSTWFEPKLRDGLLIHEI